MRTTTIRTLKVIIDADSLSTISLGSIERWENEGGAAIPDNLTPSTIPLRKGEIFEILDVVPKQVDGRLYYLVTIELLSIPK